MRQMQINVAALTAGAVLMLAAQAHAVIVQVGSAEGAAGSDTTVSVTLDTEDAEVAGTQNDIAFEAGARIKARANGRPDCTVNPAIDKAQTTFAFQPSGCEGDACTGVRALVLSFENTDAIPDGSALYDCVIAVGAGASGSLPLTCSNPGGSDPDGNALTTTCTNGTVTVGGGGPTPTPTEGGASAAIIHVGSTSGEPGQPDLSIDVTLEVPLLGTEVAGTQNDITFGTTGDVPVRIKARANGRPDCAVNPEIMKDQTTFAFQPSGCTGDACLGIRSLVLSFENTDAIPTGSRLYTCQIEITDQADVGVDYPLICSNAGASDPDGNALSTTCTNGTVEVGGFEPVTPTSTPTHTEGPGGTATSTPTGARTATRTSGIPPFVFECDDDNCAIVSPANSHSGWILLLPAALLLWLRRRSR